MDLQHWLSNAVAAIEEWQDGFGPYQADPSVLVSDERFANAFGELTGRLRNNYPFFHPSYAGQMLKPPHPATAARRPVRWKRRPWPRWPLCSAWTPTSAT